MIKRLTFLIIKALILSIVTTKLVFAFSCKAGSEEIPAGGSAKPIDVSVTFATNIQLNINAILDLEQVKCSGVNNMNAVDTLETESMNSVFAQDLFPGVKSGLIINGKKYYTPIPQAIKVIDIKSVDGGSMETKSLDVKAFFELTKQPSKAVKITAGQVIGQIDFWQKNTSPGCKYCGRYLFRLIAKTDATFVTNTCTINNGNQMNIFLGEVNRNQLKSTIQSSPIRATQQLDVRCESPVTQDIALRLVSSTTPFSKDLISTNNDNIGIAMLHNGILIKPGEEFTSHITQGSGSDQVNFSLVKKDVSASAIATGPFHGSATLIISTP